MANWFYYNKNGEKIGPISVAALKALTLQGLITRETVIANHTGRTALAGEVNGLNFPETATRPEPAAPPEMETATIDDIEPASISTTEKLEEPDEAIAMQFGNVPIHTVAAPKQSEVYGLSSPESKPEPPVEVNPFTTLPPIPESPPPIESPVVAVNNAPVEETNPFTAIMPEENNPFSACQPPRESESPFSTSVTNVDNTSIDDTPFVAAIPKEDTQLAVTLPKVKETPPKPIITVNAASSANKSVSSNGSRKTFIIAGIVVLLCGLIVVGGYRHWRHEEYRRARESLEQYEQLMKEEQKHATERIVREAMRESNESMNKILRKGR